MKLEKIKLALAPILLLLSCAAGDYSKDDEAPKKDEVDDRRLECQDVNVDCPKVDCPDCNCNNKTECPSCKTCEACPPPKSSTFIIHDCDCLSVDGIYLCTNVVCARDVPEATVFGEMTCDIMFSYYGSSIGYCDCVNLYGEICS